MTLPYITVEQLYIKWDEKISVSAERINVTKSDIKKADPFDPELLREGFRLFRLFEGWFEQIIFHTVSFNDTQAAFSYMRNAQSYLYLYNDAYQLQSSFSIEHHYLYADLTRIGAKEGQVRLTSVIAADLDSLTLYSATDILFPGAADLSLYLKADTLSAEFSALANAPLTDIKPIVDLFSLPKEVTPWISEYTHGTQAHLHELRGSLPYADPKQILNTLYASATYDDLEYTFNQNLQPIKTHHTNVVFEKGKLSIYPVAPYFYSQSGGKSWLDIDFNPAHPTLNAYILTEGQLNDDILFLLHQYGIDLPFKQVYGKTRTDLTLHIDLVDLVVTDEGNFTVQSGEFDYKGVLFKAENASVSLKDARIGIEALQLSHKDLMQADVEGDINVANGMGALKARFKTIQFAGAELNSTRTPFSLQYTIDPKGDRVALSRSSWQFGTLPLELGSMAMPFEFSSFSTNIPSTDITVGNFAKAKVSGRFKGAVPELTLDIDLGKLAYKGLKLSQARMPLSLTYTDKLRLKSTKKSRWHINERAAELAPFSMDFDAESVRLVNGAFTLDGRLSADITGTYRFAESKGTLALANILANDAELGEIYRHTKPIDAHFGLEEDAFELFCDALDARFMSADNEWRFSLSGLEKLSADSPLMQEFNLSKGSLILRSAADGDGVELLGNLDYPYALLVKDNKPITHYNIFGSLNPASTTLTINNDVNVTLDGEISVDAQNSAFNIGAILAFLNDHTDKKTSKNSFPTFTLTALNSAIYMTPERRASADLITLESDSESMQIILTHQGGEAFFEMDSARDFHFYGHDFNDRFMSGLLPLSEFKGGKMAFIINGNTDTFNGIVQVKETIMKDYKLLNNVLAFVNTVPSLVTFSLPDYSKHGLKAKEIYSRFVYSKGDVQLDAAYLDSQEVKIYGKGHLNIVKNAIDVQLNMKTDIGTQLSKVPLVGYIIMGDDGSVSTTLNLSGKLDDPTVTNALAQDIVTAPFNIIKRTLMTPFRIFDFIAKEAKKQ